MRKFESLISAFLRIVFVVFIFYGCEKKSELSKNFDCETINLENTTSMYDFNKNFKLNIPTNWKTDLYYDKYQSEIFTADTTKQLTSTYILDASFNLGKLTFDTAFYQKTDAILQASNLKKVNFGTIQFKSKPAYWYLSEGTKNNFNYQQFNLAVQLSENTFFNAYVAIYGNEKINERLCESISILETIEFLQ